MKIKHFLISAFVIGALFVSCEEINEPDQNKPDDTEQTDPVTPSDSTDTPEPEIPVDTTDTPEPEIPVDTTDTPEPNYPEATRVPVAQFKTVPLTDDGWYELAGEVRGVDESTNFFYLNDYSGRVACENVAAAYESKSDVVTEYELKGGDYIVVIGKRGEESPNDEGVSSGSAALLDGFYVRHISPRDRELSRIINADADSTWFKTVGTIIEIVDAQAGKFYITDGENTLLINGMTQGCLLEENDKSFANIGLAVRDELTLVGQKIADGELTNAFYVKHETPAPEVELPEGPTPPEGVTAATIEEILDSPVSADKWYQVTGRIQVINGGAGNLYIDNGKDEDIRIWIEKLAAAEGETPSKDAFTALGLQIGDIITVRGTRSQNQFTSEATIGGPAYFVQKH